MNSCVTKNMLHLSKSAAYFDSTYIINTVAFQKVAETEEIWGESYLAVTCETVVTGNKKTPHPVKFT